MCRPRGARRTACLAHSAAVECSAARSRISATARCAKSAEYSSHTATSSHKKDSVSSGSANSEQIIVHDREGLSFGEDLAAKNGGKLFVIRQVFAENRALGSTEHDHEDLSAKWQNTSVTPIA